MEKLAIISEDRYFVKIVNGEEVPVKVEEIKEGDMFSIYEDIDKKVKCHWDDITVFKCEGPLFHNDEDVQYIPCSLVK